MPELDDQPVVLETPPESAAVPEALVTAQPDPAPSAEPASGPGSSSQPDAGTVPADAPAQTLLEKFDAEAKAKADAAAKPAEEAKPDEAAKPAEAAAAEKVEEKKPDAAAKPEGEAAPVEAAPIDPTAPVDYFKDIKIPETITVDDAQRGELTGALDLLRGGKYAEGVQKLFDMHASTMQQFADHVISEQMRVWNKTNADWVTAVMADPVLGGNGHETAMGKVAIGRDAIASTAMPGTPRYEKEMAEFNEALRVTGAGNNPAILRAFHNASRYVREASPPPPDGKPPKDAGKNPAKKGLSSIYTHPTSNPEN